jgi:hypothetical protein
MSVAGAYEERKSAPRTMGVAMGPPFETGGRSGRASRVSCYMETCAMISMPKSATFREAIRRADELLRPAYVPLDARLIEKSITSGMVTYRLRYRSWDLVVRFRARQPDDPDSATEFSCRLIGPSVLDAIHDAIPRIEAGAKVVGPVLLGCPRYEGTAEGMAEVYHRVIHRPDVQRAIRSDATWPLIS